MRDQPADPRSTSPPPGRRRPARSRRSRFVPPAEAAARLGLAGGWREAARPFPMRWPEPYLALAEGPDGAPVRRMGAPLPEELLPHPGDLADPVGEAARSPHPYLVRKHRDRVILLVTARCHFYCRFCFRRQFPGGAHRDPTRQELASALDLVAADPDLREVILSGGDPLALTDRRLAAILRRLRAAPRIQVIRVHTRAPVHYPERVTPALARLLGSARPLWVVTHFNHPVELGRDALGALERLDRAALPLLNQSVLLAGVNDDPAVLEELFRELYARGVKPYYLHHPDPAPGNATFRVSIARGLRIYERLRARLGGPALPAYVIDLPDGSGKLEVEALRSLGKGRFRTPSGLRIEDTEPRSG